MYSTAPHNLLLKVISETKHFVCFKSKVCSKIGFSETSIFSTSKDLGLTEAITFLIKNSYFTIGNMVFNQDFGIPMGIVPAPFWANLFLYFLSLSILFLKNQLELINTTLLVNS